MVKWSNVLNENIIEDKLTIKENVTSTAIEKLLSVEIHVITKQRGSLVYSFGQQHHSKEWGYNITVDSYIMVVCLYIGQASIDSGQSVADC